MVHSESTGIDNAMIHDMGNITEVSTHNMCDSAFKPNLYGDNYWDFGHGQEPLMHRIHAYPAKFPYFITQKAVKHAQAHGIDVRCIADVFCGCGTTALEAKRMGIDFWGCDINPVATLIARVKSETYQLKRLEKYFEEVWNVFKARPLIHDAIQIDDQRISYWFATDNIMALAALKRAILTIPRGKYQDFFLCAFSNILKPASRWLTKSIKPQIDPHKKDANIRELFQRQVSSMIKAAAEVGRSESSEINIHKGNFLEMSFLHPFVDLIVTSPPYVTSYEYADLHQLSSLWLGYTDDYRKLRNGTIGSLYHDSDYCEDKKLLNSIGSSTVSQLSAVDHRKARASARYFADMRTTVSQCSKMLRSGGMLLFVIGNTEYKGVKIDNAAYLISCMEQERFTHIELQSRKISSKILTPYRDHKGRFSSDSSSRKIYADEFVVSGRTS